MTNAIETRTERTAALLAECHDDPTLRTCPFCGTDWVYDYDSIFGCDIRLGAEESFVVHSACCLDLADELDRYGFEGTYGITVEDVVDMIDPSLDVLEVIGDGDGCVVARLRTYDPAVPAGDDGKGHKRAASPKGWRDEVFADVEEHHSHHPAPQGHKFSVAVYNGRTKVGVAVVGRPVARRLAEAHPNMLEVTRVAVWCRSELRKNAVSKLYAAAAKKAKVLGYRELVTYTLADEESGHSLVAAGWTPTAVSSGGSWSRSGRERADAAPTGRKVRWEKGLNKSTRKAVAARAIELPEAEVEVEEAPAPRPRPTCDELLERVTFAPAEPVEAADPRQLDLFNDNDDADVELSSEELEAADDREDTVADEELLEATQDAASTPAGEASSNQRERESWDYTTDRLQSSVTTRSSTPGKRPPMTTGCRSLPGFGSSSTTPPGSAPFTVNSRRPPAPARPRTLAGCARSGPSSPRSDGPSGSGSPPATSGRGGRSRRPTPRPPRLDGGAPGGHRRGDRTSRRVAPRGPRRRGAMARRAAPASCRRRPYPRARPAPSREAAAR